MLYPPKVVTEYEPFNLIVRPVTKAKVTCKVRRGLVCSAKLLLSILQPWGKYILLKPSLLVEKPRLVKLDIIK